MSEKFGQALRRLRVRRKLTEEELADRLHITQSAISRFETGVREPSLLMLEDIADYFDVSMDYLFGRGIYTPRK